MESWGLLFLFGRNGRISPMIWILTAMILMFVMYHMGLHPTSSDMFSIEIFSPLLALLYFYLPVICFQVKGFGGSSDKDRVLQPIINLFLILGIALYGFGGIVQLSLGRWGNIFFSLGIIISLIAWKCWFSLNWPALRQQWLLLGKKMKDQKPDPFLCGAFFFFGLTVVFRVVGLNLVAEPFGAIGFSMLLVGLIQEIREQRKLLAKSSN